MLISGLRAVLVHGRWEKQWHFLDNGKGKKHVCTALLGESTQTQGRDSQAGRDIVEGVATQSNACVVARTKANNTPPLHPPGDKGQLGMNDDNAGVATAHLAGQATSSFLPLQRTVHAGRPVSNGGTAGALGVPPAGQMAPVLSSQQAMAHRDEEERAGGDAGDTSPTTLTGPGIITPAGLQGLGLPRLQLGQPVFGNGTRWHRLENKRRCLAMKEAQGPMSYWTRYAGNERMPPLLQNHIMWQGQMCSQNLAMQHPAASLSLKYSMGGCPVQSRQP